MPVSAQPAGFRAFAFVASFVVLIGVALSLAPTSAPAARISIVNGHSTTIDKVPWQVGLAVGEIRGKDYSPRKRFFCGGSLLTSRLVITAGHCVADLKKSQIKRIEIISGRTRLNDEAQGQVTAVRQLLMPLRPNGKRRYTNRYGSANWDVALLRLAEPLAGPTIKLAGEDEFASWAPGQLVTTTGWGVVKSENQKASPVLRLARQVMLPGGVCARFNGTEYKDRTMNCLGGPSGNASTCFGDSGGPLVARAGGEARLVGLTSFGDADCTPNLPSVDTRVSSQPIRGWVRDQALAISGVDVVGSGGLAPPASVWCRVPSLDGLTVKAARKKVEARGCRLGKVFRDRYSAQPSGKVTGASLYPGWLAPLGTGVKLWVSR